MTVFTAIDVETANADMSSICQIGLAKFDGDQLVDEWESLINPEMHFELMNSSIHGISAEDVVDAPTYEEIYSELLTKLAGNVVVTHTHFDRTALNQANTKINSLPFDVRWLDTARVARRAWTEFAQVGYGLANVCQKIGYRFNHHNALEDAKAAGQILLAASNETGLSIEQWLGRVEQPIDSNSGSSGKAIEREGNPDGVLYGEVIVFTGALQFPRNEAADLAAKAGCNVAQSVTKKTTLLCVGDQDVARLAGHNKSSKHRKAEDLIQKGQPIRIIRETDFLDIARDK